MAHLFRRSGSVNQPQQPAASMRIQQSVQGKPRLIGYGKMRVAGNLLWYGDFTATPVQSGGGGGKGTGGGASGKGSQGTQSYTYSASLMLGLGEGPITTIGIIWNNKSKTTLAQQNILGTILQHFGFGGIGLGTTLFTGLYTQAAWGYLTTLHPTQALAYRGEAFVSFGPMQLGDNPELPNMNFEVQYLIANAYSGVSDANPKSVIADFLTNAKYGVGFPSGNIDTNTLYSNYCIATGLVFSPVVADERPASDYLKDWAVATNSEYVWSGGKLKIIPYGDQVVTANGATYTPPASPVYALGDSDILPGQGNAGSPVICHRVRIEEQDNLIQVEYLSAVNDYNPAIVEAKDDAAIQVYGLKKRPVVQLHQFTRAAPAQLCASLLLGRAQVLNTYEFTAQGAFILLEPMDVLTVTDPGLGSAAIALRINEITENSDGSLSFVAEDYLAGTGSSPIYGTQPNDGHVPDYNANPGTINTPLIFEPTDELAGDLQIWGAVSGVNTTLWGGCQVWVSYDGLTYAYVTGQDIKGPSRMGVTSAQLLSVLENAQPPTLDTTGTLSVNLSMSLGVLASGSQSDVLAFNSLMYVGGEYIAFRDVTPTGTNTFNLNYLNRGGYGTTIATHSSGEKVARIDQGIFRVPFTQDRIGTTVYFKFLSFNVYGGGLQALTDVSAIAYTVVGTALSSPLPDVVNFVASFVGNITYLDWDPVIDFRAVLYEIRKGATWDGGQFVGVYAHPHIPAIGDAPYWIRAVSQPTAGLKVYSEDATLLSINGSVIPANILASYDESPSGTNWPGTLSGNVVRSGAFIQTVQIASVIYSDIYAVPDIYAIADIYAIGVTTSTGYYTIPNSHIVDMGRSAPCLIQIILDGGGQSTTDFFNPGPPDNNDFFAHSDVFDTAANRFVDIHAEIAISTDGVNFGDWQKYAAGFYNGWKFKSRVSITSIDPAHVVAFLSRFTFIVYAQTRTDHPLVNFLTSTSSLVAITFRPDGAAIAPFKGGPNGGTINPAPGIILPNPAALPGIQATIVSGAAPGDDIIISALSLAGCSLKVMNGNNQVARNVTLQAWGF